MPLMPSQLSLSTRTADEMKSRGDEDDAMREDGDDEDNSSSQWGAPIGWESLGLPAADQSDLISSWVPNLNCSRMFEAAGIV